MPRLQPGTTLSHYQIHAWIARGGMADVYQAVDVRLGRTVALKVLAPSLVADQEARRRFFREARAASALQHPNICAVYEVGEVEDFVFIAMPYIAGKTLRELLEHGPLPVERVLGYALDIAEALEEAHRQGIIHRDIKPSNVIVDERDRAIVLDFGLAKRVRWEERSAEEALTLSQITTTSALIGTTPYMSPEQVRGEPLDARSDIFAFGTLLYELLTGQRPFRGATDIEILHAILYDEPEPMSALVPNVDFELERIVRKALRKDPADRYQTISEMKEDLVAFGREKGYTMSGLRVVSLSREISERRPRAWRVRWRVPLIPATTVSLIGAGIALALWLSLRSEDPPGAEWIASLHHTQLINWKNEPGESPPRARFSPDGKMIVFASRKGGHPDLWVQQTLGGASVQVTRDEWGDRSPIWSPDGQQIAFLSDRGGELGIWVIPALGGVPTLLHVVSHAASARLSPVNMIAWSAARNTIYYEAHRNLYALDVASRRITALTDFDPQTSRVVDFSLSPDERRIAYVDVQGGQADVWVLPLEGGRPMRVTESPEEERFPVWHPDGRRLFYACKHGEVYQICLSDLDRRTPLRLTSSDADLFVSDVSADGRRVLYSLSKDDADIWGVNLQTGEEFPVTTEIGLELWPEVSPDGRAIAFQAKPESSAGGDLFRSQIVVRTLGGEEPVIRFTTSGFDPAWSPDGRHLALLRRDSGGQLDLWVVPASGGVERRVTSAGVSHGGYGLLPFNRLQTRDFSWSPDGRRLAYASLRTGASNIWITVLDRSEEIRVTDNTDRALSFFCPLWAPDGRRLAFISESRTAVEARWKVWVSEVDRRRTILLLQSQDVVRLVGWMSDEALLIASARGLRLSPHVVPEVHLMRVAVSNGAKRHLGTLSAASLVTLSLLSHGRMIAYVSRADDCDNLWTLSMEGGRATRRTRNKDPRVYLSTLAWAPDGRTLYYGRQASWSVIRVIENLP